MDPLALFKIPFMGIKTGKHEFQIYVDQEFFSYFPESEIEDASGQVTAVLERADTNMVLYLSMDLIWNVPCGRCLEALNFKLIHELRIPIQFGETTNITDELWIMGKNEFELDLSQIVFEMAHLVRPPHQVHEDAKDCDPKMLDYLKSDEDEESDSSTDPRWDALKNLK